MLALTTHDTKRTADVRSRLAVITEIADEWTATVDRWRTANARHRPGWDDPVLELELYQTLVGAWPIDRDRLVTFAYKAAREAKQHTSWLTPDEGYEAGLEAFVSALLDDDSFTAEIEAFLAEHDIVERADRLSLARVALACTSPGVPDTYQGDEVVNLALVDPDNRRPVDFTYREALLDRIAGREAATLQTADERKLWLLHRLLQHRRGAPHLYATDQYEPLDVEGADDRVVAFRRGGLVAIAACRSTPVSGRLRLPTGSWVDVLSDATRWEGELDAGALLRVLPAAVLEQEQR